MEEGSRSGERKRRPSGCLIVKKKVDGMSNGGFATKQRGIESKERKRPRLILSDSDSAEEDFVVSPPPSKLIRRDTTPDSFDIGTSVAAVRNITSDSFQPDRNRKLGILKHKEDTRVDRNKFFEAGIERSRDRISDIENSNARIERKKNRGNDIEYTKGEKFGKGVMKEEVDQRRTEIGRNGVLISKSRVPIGIPREFDSSRSIKVPLEDRGQKIKLSVDKERDSICLDRQKLKMKRYGPGLPREKFEVHHSEPIRVQGKNGVLKLMPKHKVAALDTSKKEENRRGSTLAAYSKGKTHSSPPLYPENRNSSYATSVVVTEKKEVLKKCKHNDIDDRRKEDSAKLNKLPVPHNDRKTEGSETSLSRESKDVATCSSKKEFSNKKNQSLDSGPCVPTMRKEEVKRGNGTEKQLLREQIRQMLVDAGWRIDLRPRRNRDYQDSVYVNPSGTEYWSITKAYNAFQKQFEEEHKDKHHGGDLSPFTPIPADVLGKLTRKTRKKMERETKMQEKSGRGTKNPKEGLEKSSKKKRVKTDSGISEENSHVTQDGKSLKVTIKRNSGVGLNIDDLDRNKKCDIIKAGGGNGEHKKQRGRALLVRSSSKGLNMGDDDFVPYTGKRTLLSWLIDMEAVRLSAKVQYMNKKRTRAMLEGWVTRDGIHCGCCSKILTISKFELHAGSKLHHPFLNIFVEDGVSLHQCQLDAWNRQDKSVRLGYHFIDVSDDPNDDTCGICGDGGDLICCDGCPSTFHQSCLDIQMLPSGDWLCPNCSCKFCGGVDGSTGQDEGTKLCSCSLCEAKYHRLCRQQADATSIDCDSSSMSFCEKACEELFQKLQKLLGVKHELEAGFSWTLIQRSNLDPEASSRGQCRKAEWNSKIAVALTVMDECFLPFIDQRTGVNLIHNVLFNIGSNFNRLNYSGFYTAVLERGDEIIAAASIRIHGTRLAEMPFIGTRHIYRRQGMCRRLLHAIESFLSSLNVEKLIIPAISELMHTWTTVFGFKPLEESQRQDVKTLNMLVFPSTDLLQKPLLKHKSNEVDLTVSSVVKVNEQGGNSRVMHETSENTGIISVEPDTCSPPKSADGDQKMNSGVSSVGICPRSPGGSAHDSFDMINNLSDASLKNIPGSSGDCSAPETKLPPHSGGNHDDKLEVGTNTVCSPSLEPKLQICIKDEPREKAGGLEYPLDETLIQYPKKISSKGHIAVSGYPFQPTNRAPKPINSDQSEQNVDVVEIKADLCSVAPGICAPDEDTVYDQEMNCQVASARSGPQYPVGSKCDNTINSVLDSATGSIPDRLKEEFAPDSELLHNIVDHDIDFGVETKTFFTPSNELKLQSGTDAHKVKIETVGVENDLNTLDETPVQHPSNIHCDYSNAVSYNSRTGGDHVQSNYDLNEHNFDKVECKSELNSSKLGVSTCEKSVLYDRDGIATPEISSSCPSGSTYDTSDMEANPLDVTLRPVPDALVDESALESKFHIPREHHDVKLDVGTKSSVEPDLENCVIENTEAAITECRSTHRNDSYAISGNCFQDTSVKPGGRSLSLNPDDLHNHNMGCATDKVCHVVSHAIDSEPDVLSRSDESTEKDASQVKFEVSVGVSNLYPSDEGNADNQIEAAALGNSFQVCGDNIVSHVSMGTSPPLGEVSDYNHQDSCGTLAHRHEFQFLKDVHGDPRDASGTISNASELGNNAVPDE